MIARPLARAMLASWFVSQGIDAVRHPDKHAAAAAPALRPVAERAGSVAGRDLGVYLEGPILRRVVQVHGAITALTGLSLVLGKAPRTAALVLAGLTAPLLLANLPVRVAGETREDREARRDRLIQALTATGGAILAAVDREGRPGVAWRIEHAREARAAARGSADDA
ncbi:MAG: DoxX family protein [Actinomycetales bacterium]|nr:DoxX family protein [Actinomycetales bacterium]